jgi:flagellar biosynthesis/type III secretory pathway chaperone
MKEKPPSPKKPARPPEISLYEELLECLEQEWQALVNSQEDAILTMAARKEQILGEILRVRDQNTPIPGGPDQELLGRLKRQAAAIQARNHRLIATALETIQDFLGFLQAGPPGIYHAAGKVETTPGNSFFHRQA